LFVSTVTSVAVGAGGSVERPDATAITDAADGESDGCEHGGGEVSGSARVGLVESCSLDEIRCRDDESGSRLL